MHSGEHSVKLSGEEDIFDERDDGALGNDERRRKLDREVPEMRPEGE